jgi:hypothetical protein
VDMQTLNNHSELEQCLTDLYDAEEPAVAPWHRLKCHCEDVRHMRLSPRKAWGEAGLSKIESKPLQCNVHHGRFLFSLGSSKILSIDTLSCAI